MSTSRSNCFLTVHHLAMVLIVFMAGSSTALAASNNSVCDPSSLPQGAWISYCCGTCGNFHLGWGNSGTDRARFDPNIPRDTYALYIHAYNRRTTGDTSADCWAVHAGGTSGYTFNQSGSGRIDNDMGRHPMYGNSGYIEVGSDGGGAMDTIADEGLFYTELDAVYSSRQAEASMYAGNVYYWRWRLNNAGYWGWGAGSDDRFARIGGSFGGPGWTTSNRVAELDVAAGANVDIWFNVRPTTVASTTMQFQMVRENVSWFGDKPSTNGNMELAVSSSRKAPWAHNYGDDGAKKKGETVRFFVEGSDSFADSNAYSWDFDGPYSQGWSAASQCTVTQEDANNRLKVDVTGGDPHIQSSPGLAINTTANKYLAVRMWASGGSSAKLYWANESGGYSESRQVEWNIAGDSAWHDYVVYLPDGTGWGGTVNRVRMDVVNTGAASGQTVYIDYLRIYDETKMNGKIWIGTADGTWDIHENVAMDWDAVTRRWYKDYTITGNYPQVYYVVLRAYNDAGTHCENDDRQYGDGAANREYQMANTAPTAENTNYSGDAWTSVNTPTLEWSYVDADSNAQSHYRVQVDNDSDFSSPEIDTGDVESAATSYTTAALADGQWYWRVLTQDGFDESAWSAGTSFRVDTTAPTNPTGVTETNGAADGVWQSTVDTPAFEWSGADDGAGSGVKDYAVYFGTDSGGTSATYQTEASLAPGTQAAGEYFLRILTRDNVDIEAAWATGFTFRYDNVAPTSSCSTETTLTMSALTDISWTADDAHSGPGAIALWYKKGEAGVWTQASVSDSGAGGTFASWTPPEGDGTYYIRSQAGDQATPANAESDLPEAGDDSFVYDTTAPDVIVSQAEGQDDPAVILPITFTVVFSEEVADFDETDVTLGGTASGFTYNVTGSGTTYTIEITAIDQPGTVIASVAAASAHDAAGNPNAESAGGDNEVTYVPAPPPSVLSWASERSHGGSPFSLSLPAEGTPAVECRRYGVRKLVIQLSRAVAPADGTLDTGDVVVTDSQNTPYTPSQLLLVNDDQTIEVYFDGGSELPDVGRYTFDIAGKFIERDAPARAMVGDTDCQVVCLKGDVNGDLKVNLIDVAAVKTHRTLPVDATTFRYEITVDGSIDMIDVALARSMHGQVAP